MNSRLFWLIAYLFLSCALLNRSILWLFFNEGDQSLPFPEMFDVWSMTAIWIFLFIFVLWKELVQNQFPTTVEKIMVLLIVLCFVCNLPLTYALGYKYLGIMDGNMKTTDTITCFYFSIVTWTTLGYGDVRPSPDARLLAASEAVVGYLFMAAFIGMFSVLFRQIFGKVAIQSAQDE
jgi:hypothetical protein